MMTFVKATYVQAIFINISNISAVTDPISMKQIPAVTVIFVQATFVQVTFIYIKNILAVTDPILIKL